MTDYTGKTLTMESFTITTDANGENIITLAHAPTDINAVVVQMGDDLRVAWAKALTTTSLTVKIRKYATSYDKSDNTVDSGTLTSGVTVESGATITSSASSANTVNQLNAASSTGGSNGSVATSVHTHTHAKIFEHGHGHTTTDCNSTTTEMYAVSEADLKITVMYAYTP